MKRVIEVWTDGACRGNGSESSVGGYGVVLSTDGFYKELKGAQFETTNNAQEILAMTIGLEAIKSSFDEIKVFGDSAYVINGLNNKWYKKWRFNGWKTSKGTPVANRDLWERLIKAYERFTNIKLQHVPGHSGIDFNERADALANEAIEELIAGETFSH